MTHLEGISARDIHLIVQQSQSNRLHFWFGLLLASIILLASLIFFAFFKDSNQQVGSKKEDMSPNPVKEHRDISADEYLGAVKKLGITSTQLGVTQKILDSFLRIVEKHQVSLDKLSDTLLDMAKRYRELLENISQLVSDDVETTMLLTAAKQALEQANFDTAEHLYNQASERESSAVKAIKQEEQHSKERREERQSVAAGAKYAILKLKMMQLAYLEAAHYGQQAIAFLPTKHTEQLRGYLMQTSLAFYYAGHFSEAKSLYELSLTSYGKTSHLINLSATQKIEDYCDEPKTFNFSLDGTFLSSICKRIRGDHEESEIFYFYPDDTLKGTLSTVHGKIEDNNEKFEILSLRDQISRYAYLAYLTIHVRDILVSSAVSRLENRLKVHVTEITPNSPIEKTGIQSGDVLINYDEKPVINTESFQIIRNQEPTMGKLKSLEIQRKGETIKFVLAPKEDGMELEDYIIEK